MAKNRKKYIRLAQGEAMWKHQTANLSLQAFTTQNIANGDKYGRRKSRNGTLDY